LRVQTSYTYDITTTSLLENLFNDVNRATAELQRSRVVPPDVAQLVDEFDQRLHAEAPLQLEADPYLTTMMFAAALRAEKALRQDDADLKRRELRLALEQFRQALRDILANQPFGADTHVRQVLANLVGAVSTPQAELALLLGVSTRQLQRWLAADGAQPAGREEARLRVVAQVVNQLRHSFTAPGVVEWFRRVHPHLLVKPLDLLSDPLRYPELLAAATGARVTTG
jgi:hypothetical protein